MNHSFKKKNVNVDRYIMRTSHFLQMKFYAKVCMRYKIIKIYSFQIIKMHSVLLKGTFLFKILTKESFLFIFVASLLGKTTNIYGYRYIYMCLSSQQEKIEIGKNEKLRNIFIYAVFLLKNFVFGVFYLSKFQLRIYDKQENKNIRGVLFTYCKLHKTYN